MKAIHWILTAALALMTGSVAQAQDDAYLTPSKAQVERRQAKEAYARAMAEERAEEARRDSIRAARLKAQDQATDWYNRRGMKVTIEDMERNLDSLDGTISRNGGKYAARMRRFNGDDDGRIVLNDVEKVYVMDDYRYDPWSRSYYGRGWDRDRDVYITINTDPWYSSWRYGWGGYYPSYYPWYGGYGWGWGGYYDPWYGNAGWWGGYDPWYDPFYYGYGYTWSWGRPYRYYGYAGSYWSGYNDGWYSHDYARRYTPSARRTESYYDRHAATYGRALGSGNVTRWSSSERPTYSRSTGSVYGRRPVIGTTRYDQSAMNDQSRRMSRVYGTSNNSTWDNSSTRSTSTYSPSRSTGTSNSSSGANTGTSTGSGRGRR